jgi:hypothetical protein
VRSCSENNSCSLRAKADVLLGDDMDNGEGVVVVAVSTRALVKRPFKALAGVDVGTVTSVTSIHACSFLTTTVFPFAVDDCDSSWLEA